MAEMVKQRFWEVIDLGIGGVQRLEKELENVVK